MKLGDFETPTDFPGEQLLVLEILSVEILSTSVESTISSVIGEDELVVGDFSIFVFVDFILRLKFDW